MTDEEIKKNVEHPSHYTSSKTDIEVIEITRWLCCDLGNFWKYISRYTLKNTPKQDILKAIWYINDFKEHPCHPYCCNEIYIDNLLFNMQKIIDAEEIIEIKNGFTMVKNIISNIAGKTDEAVNGKKTIEDLEKFANTLK